MNTPVNRIIARILKKSGFTDKVLSHYLGTDLLCDKPSYNFNNPEEQELWNEELLSAPTIAEVVMWIYKKYGIWIRVGIYTGLGNLNNFQFDIEQCSIKNINSMSELNLKSFKSPEEAYETAIEYTLNKLI